MDAMRISIMAWPMSQIADNKELDRIGPVATIPNPDGSADTFEFTIKDDEFPHWGGTFRVKVERVSE